MIKKMLYKKMDKKARFAFYFVLFGVLCAFAALYYYNSMYEKKSEVKSPEIFEQLAQRDLEQASIKSYLGYSGKLALSDSIHSLSNKGWFADTPLCGSYAGFPLYQTEDNSTAECMPDLKAELAKIYPGYIQSYLERYPEDLRSIDLDYSFSLKDRLAVIANAKEKILLPLKEGSIEKEESSPFDVYEITAYTTVFCDEYWNDVYNVRLTDKFSTKGYKYLFADVRYPFKTDKLEEGSELYYLSAYKVTNQNQLLSYPWIGSEIGKYCIPLAMPDVTNLQLTTFKDGKEVCKVRLFKDNYSPEKYIKPWYKESSKNGVMTRDCRDAPTSLECPGIRVNFCQRNYPYSFSNNPEEFLGWEKPDSGNSDINDNFAWVWQADEPKDERPFSKYLHARVSAKFLVQFSPKFVKKEAKIEDTKELRTTAMVYNQAIPLEKREFSTDNPTFVYRYIKPSFESQLSYDVQDFEYIKNQLKKLDSECASKDNIKDCIQSQIDAFNKDAREKGYGWSILDKQDPYLLTSFIDKVARLLKDDKQAYYMYNSAYQPRRNYQLIITEEKDGYRFNINGFSYPIVTDKKVDFSNAISAFQHLTDIKDPMISLRDGKVDIKPASKSSSAVRLPDRYFLFRLTTNKKFFPYSDPIRYDFAAYIRDDAPIEIKGIEAIAKEGEESSAIVYFNIPKESDIDHFNLYYTSDFDLKGKKIVDGRINHTIDGKSYLVEAKLLKYPAIDRSSHCFFNSLDSECEPTIELERLYKENDLLFFKIPLKNKQEYSMTITAVDKNKNEITEVKDAAKITADDRLSPGKVDYKAIYDPSARQIDVTLDTPVLNIDGTRITKTDSDAADISAYYIFAKAGDCSGIVNSTYFVNLAKRDEKKISLLFIQSMPIQNGGYCIAVIAADSSDNPLSVIQSGTGKKLMIKPEYSKVIGELANPQIVSVSDSS